jgi:hypothetical protein
MLGGRAINRKDAAADDFRGEGRLVQRQSNNSSREWSDELRRIPAQEIDVRIRHANGDRLVEVTQIVEDQQQHDQWDRPEDPDIGPGNCDQQRRAGDPRQRQCGAKNEAKHGAKRR